MKMSFFTTILLLQLGASMARSESNLVPFRSHGKWGYSTPDGKVKVPAKYDSVSSSGIRFSVECPSAHSVRSGKFMALVDDSTGKEIPLGQWNSIESFPYVNIFLGNSDPDILAFKVRKNGKYGIISNSGIRISAEYDRFEARDVAMEGPPGARPFLYPLIIGYKKGEAYMFDSLGRGTLCKGSLKFVKAPEVMLR